MWGSAKRANESVIAVLLVALDGDGPVQVREPFALTPCGRWVRALVGKLD